MATTRQAPGYTQRITLDPNIMVGKPVVTGTRIPVELVLQHLAADLDVNDILEAFPRLTVEDIKACIKYARWFVERERAEPVTERPSRLRAPRG